MYGIDGFSLLISVSSCTNEDEIAIIEKTSNCTSEVINCSDGTILVLDDTVTYHLELLDLFAEDVASDALTVDIFNVISRSYGSVLKEFGYDKIEPESDWKKCYPGNDWKPYGVMPGIYIGRYVSVYKNLPIETNTYARPADYT